MAEERRKGWVVALLLLAALLALAAKKKPSPGPVPGTQAQPSGNVTSVDVM